MFANALLILPDFALILIGWGLMRTTPRTFDRGFWSGTEKLVYYVLFPALLFNSINSAQFSLASDIRLIIAAVATFLIAVAFGFAAKPLLKPPADVFAGCVQTAFRFNTYIALAVAQAILGVKGVALLALIMAFIVPLANLFAVYALAQQRQSSILPELATNPLLLATLGGLLTNLMGWKLPVFAATLLTRLGGASIALGLLCVGAGLMLTKVQARRSVIAYFVVVKLVAYPAIALLLARTLQLPETQAQSLTLFAAVPTASTAYVLASRMGVNAAPVAYLISAQTLLSMFTLPIWISLAAS
jgi:malonate transporter